MFPGPETLNTELPSISSQAPGFSTTQRTHHPTLQLPRLSKDRRKPRQLPEPEVAQAVQDSRAGLPYTPKPTWAKFRSRTPAKPL